MDLRIDEYAHIDSPIHRWHPRAKLLALSGLIILFSLVRDLRWVPPMLALTAALYLSSRLPLQFLFSRLRYPGIFLLVMVVILPFFTGQTVIWQAGPLALRAEGIEYMLLVVGRFASILTVSLVLFGTSTLPATAHALRSLGVPSRLTDMLLLTLRYIAELAKTLAQMQLAMRLRGFAFQRLNQRNAASLAGLIGTLLVRSYEQSVRVYHALQLRGYAMDRRDKQPTMATAQKPALQLDQVRFAYPNRAATLNGISFMIHYGERVGLVGPNGAGKTTLFLTICGVLQPGDGQIAACGQEVHAGHFNPALGLVFQNPDDQLFSPLVRDDVAFGPLNMGLDATLVEAQVNEALALTGTTHLAGRVPHHLSGGEKRMVAIASTLAMKPQLVLYDEPDANLDVRSRRRLIHFLASAPHTLLVASHDLEFILEVCNRVLVLDGGRIIADGDPRQVLADTALMEAHGLEKPHSLIPHTHPPR